MNEATSVSVKPPPHSRVVAVSSLDASTRVVEGQPAAVTTWKPREQGMAQQSHVLMGRTRLLLSTFRFSC
jgi:hypothetical protein